MGYLRALANGRLLDFDMRAGLGAFAQVGTRAQIRARAAFGSVVNLRFDSDRFVNASVAANLRVG